MVDLPNVGSQIVTSTAPVSSVSRGDIQQNADMMANSLAKVADATMDIATQEAKKQAADDLQNQKVTRDADGNVTVANPIQSPLLFGRAGDAYEDAVRAGTVAQHGNVISQELNDLHQKYPADPKAFMAAADNWRQTYMAQHGGGQIGELLARTFDQTATQHFNAIADVAGKADLTKASTDISTSQQSALDDATAMARGGTSTNDPAIQAKFEQWDRAAAARLANPLFAYSQAQYESDAKGFHDQVAGSAFIHDVDKSYKDQGDGGGYKGAMAKAETILTDPNYGLSQQQREAFYHRATAEIRANEAIRHQDVAEARASFNELTMVSAAGGAISSDDVEHIAAAARAAGDPGLAARVYSSFIRKPLNDSFGQQPLATQTLQLNALHGANAAAFVNSALIAKGYSPIAAAGIVGNTIHESGVDPTAVGDHGTSGGIAQLHAERLANLKAFAAARGKPASDLQTQVDFIDHELHTTETGTLAKLQAAKTPEEAGAAFIDYERPQGWTPQNPAGGLGYESRKALARQVYDGKPADMSMGPAGSMWLEANRERTVGTAAYTQWQAVMKDYRESNIRPPLQTVNDIVNAARVSRNPDLLDTIAHDSEVMNIAGQSAQSPLAVQQSNITDMTAAGNAGRLSPGNSALITDLQRKYNAISKGLDESPIATTVANFPDKVKDPGPLDYSNPIALAAGLQARSKIAKFGAQNWQTAPLSVLDQQDVKSMQAALQGPAGPAVLGGLQNGLQAAELNTLFDKTKLGDAITGMSRSGDPAKMTAAFNFMDNLQKQNPMQFNRQFPEGLRDLRAWQSMTSLYSPDVIAKKMETFFSPQEVEARKASDEVANEALKNVSPDKVVAKFSTGWGPFGTSARSPVGAETSIGAAGALKADYDASFREGFAVTRDATMADQYAMEKLGHKYAVSPTNNNRVMAHAPENPEYYPMVNGSYDWMGKQLDEAVSKATGVDHAAARRPNTYELKQLKGNGVTFDDNPLAPFAPSNPIKAAALRGQRMYAAPRVLVSDPTTESDIADGKPPSYLIMLQEPNGRWGAMTDPNGAMSRIRFDPAKPFADHAAAAETKRAAIAFNPDLAVQP